MGTTTSLTTLCFNSSYASNLEGLRKCKELITALKKQSEITEEDIKQTKATIDKCVELSNEFMMKKLEESGSKYSLGHNLAMRQYEILYKKAGKIEAGLKRALEQIQIKNTLRKALESTSQNQSNQSFLKETEQSITQKMMRPFYYDADNLQFATAVLNHIQSLREASVIDSFEKLAEASHFLSLSKDDQLQQVIISSNKAQGFIKRNIPSLPPVFKNLLFSEMELAALSHKIKLPDRSKLESECQNFPQIFTEACNSLLKKIKKPPPNNNNSEGTVVIDRTEIPIDPYKQIHEQAINLKQKLDNVPPINRRQSIKDFIDGFKVSHPLFYQFLSSARTVAVTQNPSLDEEVALKKMTPEALKSKIGPNGWDKEYGLWHLGDDLTFFINAVEKGIEELRKQGRT